MSRKVMIVEDDPDIAQLVQMHLHEIEGTPLDAEQIAMFEMFEREAWSHERRRAYLAARAKGESVTDAAE